MDHHEVGDKVILHWHGSEEQMQMNFTGNSNILKVKLFCIFLQYIILSLVVLNRVCDTYLIFYTKCTWLSIKER